MNEHRVWIDGCFDFTHHGHSGAILQARRTIHVQEGTKDDSWLICGVHSDKDIAFHKGGKPVMQEEERYAHTASNRWCDEVVRDAPYVTDPAVLDQHGCYYVVHGDDITTDANGEDCYQVMKNNGRFKFVKRTEGVSTTDIIHRILMHEFNDDESTDAAQLAMYSTGRDGYSAHCWVFHHDLDHVLIAGRPTADPESWLVVEDAFDLFHMGHIEKLASIKRQHPGRMIVCSVRSGNSYMSLNERCLTVLSCRHVDGILVHRAKHTAVDVELDHWDICGGARFQYLDKHAIIQRIEADKDHYIQRNIRKGMDMKSYTS